MAESKPEKLCKGLRRATGMPFRDRGWERAMRGRGWIAGGRAR
jgi:hypothetical protein